MHVKDHPCKGEDRKGAFGLNDVLINQMMHNLPGPNDIRSDNIERDTEGSPVQVRTKLMLVPPRILYEYMLEIFL